MLQTSDSGVVRPKENILINATMLAMSAVTELGQPVVTGKRKKKERMMHAKSRLMVLRVSSACPQRIGAEIGEQNRGAIT